MFCFRKKTTKNNSVLLDFALFEPWRATPTPALLSSPYPMLPRARSRSIRCGSPLIPTCLNSRLTRDGAATAPTCRAAASPPRSPALRLLSASAALSVIMTNAKLVPLHIAYEFYLFFTSISSALLFGLLIFPCLFIFHLDS